MESAAIMVIPCYNEATRLQVSTFKAFICMRPAVRFLFVDDGSTDRTWQVLEGCIRTIPSTLPSITMLRTEARLRPYVRGSCAPLRPVQSMWAIGTPISRRPSTRSWPSVNSWRPTLISRWSSGRGAAAGARDRAPCPAPLPGASSRRRLL